MNDLVTTKLGNVCRVINGRAYKQSELLENGKFRVLRVGNFFTNNNWYYSNLDLPEDKYCSEGDLLFAWSASFGPRIWSGEKVIYHYHIWKLEEKEDTVDKLFLYYYLLNKTKSMLGSTHGSIMLHLTKSFMESQPISFPRSLQKQRRIANTLQQIDKKISLNNRINAELEALAKTVYDYWFVQFDFPISADLAAQMGDSSLEGKPYKSSGGAMVWDERVKREVPKGWEAKRLKQIVHQSNESTDPSLEPEKNYRLFSIPAFDELGSYRIEKGSSIKSNKFVVKGTDILVSKLNPRFSRIIYAEDEPDLISSTEFVVWRAPSVPLKNFCFILAQNTYFKAFCIQNATGSSGSHRRINPKVLMNYFIPFDEEIINRYGELIGPHIQKINSNRKENRELASLRDWLLPMLMNGQVKVSSAKAREQVGEGKYV